jgi:hypothetical protein
MSEAVVGRAICILKKGFGVNIPNGISSQPGTPKDPEAILGEQVRYNYEV